MIDAVFGSGANIDILQECTRAVLIFVYGFVMLRISGKRTFSQWSAADIVISIIVGSCLSRTLTGNAPLVGTLIAVAVLVGLHLTFGYAVAISPVISRIIEGSPVVLAKDGVLRERARISQMISMCDLGEALRQANFGGIEDIKKTKQITLEPSGKISLSKAGG
jgi:uncharacterized membrane protein YcaP (DUF421 family)